MTTGSLVLDVLLISRIHGHSKRTYRSGDGDTSSLLLGCFVNSTVVHEFSTVLLGQVFCDGSSQCRLSVVDVLSVSFPLISYGQIRHTPMVPMLHLSAFDLISNRC